MKKEFKLIDPYEHELHTYLWETDDPDPKGVVQLLHGASEYCERYDDFAKYLTTQGFHVIGNDHLGHGKTSSNLEYVYFESTLGFHQLYEGVRSVRDYIEENYPKLPVIMFAHSMGSFIGRYTILNDHARYDQAIFSGTGLMGSFSVAIARLLATAIAKIKGDTYVSKFFNHRVLDGQIRSMKKNGIINHRIEWITDRPDIMRAVKEDKYCGMPFTISAQRDILKLLPEIQDKNMIEKSASATAIYFISGDLDGLGHYGADAKKLYNMYHDCGYSNVKYSVLNNTRHEIINAQDYKAHYRLISDWIIRNL